VNALACIIATVHISLCHCRVERKSGRIRCVKPWQITLVILAALSVSLALAEDFKTTKGQEYKDANVSRVEPDGIVIKFSGGIVKIPFTELPPEIQRKYGYDPKPSSTAAIDSQISADLMSHAESALRTGQFAQGADLLNRIVLEYPTSRQAQTVHNLRAVLREKQQTQSGPLTVNDARRLRSLMDALANIKKGYYTTTPEKRRALNNIFGADTFRDTDNGLDSLSSSSAKLGDAIDQARGEP
jgi:hypothetical protein